jgi:RNA polymerase sigma-70 factor (ECF subfamily)
MKLRATAATSDLDAALPHLRRYARVLMDAVDEADALLLDTLEHARAKARQPLPLQSLRTRLFGLMHELYVSRHSGSRAEPKVEPVTEPVTATEPFRSSGLLMYFGRLPVEEREVLLLAAVEQMAYADIATVLGVPPATVIARLKRARERMRTGASASSEGGLPI